MGPMALEILPRVQRVVFEECTSVVNYSEYTNEHTSITVSGGHYQQWLEDISCGGICGSTQISYYMMKM